MIGFYELQVLETSFDNIIHFRGHEPNKIHIYSASWGPTDDGKTVDGPRNSTMRAIVKGVNEGRNGLGSIYVWASGDGGENDDWYK